MSEAQFAKRPRRQRRAPSDAGAEGTTPDPREGGAGSPDEGGVEPAALRPKRKKAAPKPAPAGPGRLFGQSRAKKAAGRGRKKKPARRPWSRLWDRLRRAWRIWMLVPPAIRLVLVLALGLLLLAGSVVAYHVWRKPSEVFMPLAETFKKTPEETWAAYGGLFREFSTARVPAELLAALAQVEGAGNPVAHTYWRWTPSLNPFEIYRPASSAVGMYQMTDAAFADAQRYCIRNHAVVPADGIACKPPGLQSRLLAAHAVELTAVSLDRQTAALLGAKARGSARQVQDVAALIHLCGAGAARRFAANGFRPPPGASCGDHDPAYYVDKVNAMKERFRTIALRGRQGP